MPVTSFHDYASQVQLTLSTALLTGSCRIEQLRIDPRSLTTGFIAGTLILDDASELHFREFVDVSLPEPRFMYAYHYQDREKQLVFRYDNAAHRPALPQSAHKHTLTEVLVGEPPSLAGVIDEAIGSKS